MMKERQYFELVECQGKNNVDSFLTLHFKGNQGTLFFLPFRREGFVDAFEMMGKHISTTVTWSFCPWCGGKWEG
jgi:hypothetical protein